MEAHQQDLRLARWQLAPCVAAARMSSTYSICGSSSPYLYPPGLSGDSIRDGGRR
jgi:hypothetical protein